MRATAITYPARIQRFRLPRVCAAVVGSDPAQMIERAESLVRDNLFIEFRLDYLSQPATALPRLKHFLDVHPEVMVVATCRRVANGGKFKGSVSAEVDVLTKAASLGFQGDADDCARVTCKSSKRFARPKGHNFLRSP